VQLTLPLAVYLCALCLFGLALEANIIGAFALMLEIAPANRRPSYVAFLNTVAFPLTFLPAVVGALVGEHTRRLDIVFVAVAVGGLLTILAARQLGDVRAGKPAAAADAPVELGATRERRPGPQPPSGNTP